jgi:UDP-glucose 4-epimerase
VEQAGVTWLITGGCGFLATSLIARLREHGAPGIRVIDNMAVGQREDLAACAPVVELPADSQPARPEPGGPVQLVRGDVRDADLMRRLCESVDVVVHLAASTGVIPSLEDPRRDLEVNVVGTLNCLEAARRSGVTRFVFASSGAALGEKTPPLHEELAATPASPYGAGKRSGEAYCSAYHHSYGLGTVALRFGNVYGPRSSHKGSVVAKFIRQAIARERARVYGDGGQTRDFIYVDDVVAAIVACAEATCGGEVFQIASGREVTVNELLTTLQRVLARNGLSLEADYEPARAGEVLRNYSDTSKAFRVLGWQARVDLETGLERTVRWFLGQ